MNRKYVYSGTTWFDILSADTNELSEISNLYGLEDALIKKIANNNNETSIRKYGAHTFISLNIPQYSHKDSLVPTPNRNISFVIGDDFVITSRFSDINGLKQFKKELSSYDVTPEHFPSFFFKTLLIYLYEELKTEIVTSIPSSKIKSPETITRGKYLISYKSVLQEHTEIVNKVASGTYNQLCNDTQVSCDLVEQVLCELLETISEQEKVCVTCIYSAPPKTFAFFNFLRN